jgi:hypothetical protein
MSQCPPAVEPYARDPNLTPGREYDVHAVSVYEGVASVLVIDDADYPGWLPTWLFTPTEHSIPSDWLCNSFPDWPDLLVGPDFIAGSQEGYRAMVELELPQVLRLRLRIAPTRAGEEDG